MYTINHTFVLDISKTYTIYLRALANSTGFVLFIKWMNHSSQQICLHFHTKLRMKWAFDLIERCLSLNGLPCHIPEQHEAMCRYDYHGLDKRLYIKAQNNWNGVLERVLLSIANNTIETGKKMIMEHMHVHMFRKPLELPQTHTHFAASNRNNLHHTTYFLFFSLSFIYVSFNHIMGKNCDADKFVRCLNNNVWWFKHDLLR